MEWLNYHHLLYFWVAAKQRSIAAASRELHLAHPTISGQIRRLEESLGQRLFIRSGRKLTLTDSGRIAFRYADQIFALGHEFMDTVKERSTERPLSLVVGISDALPKSIVHQILEPAFRLDRPMRVVCWEDRPAETFLAELAAQALDVVLSDAPAGPGAPARLFSHPLGECDAAFFAAPELARSLRRRFPASLDGAPFLLPATVSTLRRSLDEWFDARGIRPRVIAELDDAALTDILAEAGLGVFAAPEVVEPELRRRYRVQRIGVAEGLRQRFYAVSLERKLKHPGVLAIRDAARQRIFA